MFVQARLFTETHERVKELVSLISRRGWEGLGIDRDDPPSGSTVIDAAINILMERAKPTAKGKTR